MGDLYAHKISFEYFACRDHNIHFCRNSSGFINTRLNFSEADSTFGAEEGNSSRHHLISSFGRATFNSTLDLERRVSENLKGYSV